MAQFVKWTIKKPQYSVPLLLGLGALGSGAAFLGSSLLGGTMLAARNARVAINGSDESTEKTTTPDSSTELSIELEDGSSTAATDDARFEITTERPTPWMEAISDLITEPERITDSHQAPSETNHTIRLDTYCRTFKPGFIDGRVELLVNGTWGAICQDYFTNAGAKVVCRQAGFSTDNARKLSIIACSPSPDPILLARVICRGDENNILDCTNSGIGVHDCGYRFGVAVRCQKTVRFLPNNETTPHRGTPQMLYNGTWASILADGLGTVEAGIFCHDLDFPGEHATVTTSGRNDCHSVTDPVIQGIRCKGGETSIHHCHNQGWVNIDAPDTPCPLVNVNCKPNVRLVLSYRSYQHDYDQLGRVAGRVEVFHNDTWRMVSHNGFKNSHRFHAADAALVVCREQGYPTGQNFISSLFNPDTHYIYFPKFNFISPAPVSPLLTYVHCSGNEASLMDCDYQISLLPTPRRYAEQEVAIVYCSSGSQFSDHPLLDAGDVTGRVKVWHNGEWGDVCAQRINNVTAGVICRDMGYPAAGAMVFPGNTTVTENSTIISGNVTCSGNEGSIVDCHWEHEPESSGVDRQCSHAVVICKNRIRLVPAGCSHKTGTVSGRLQFLHKGKWRSICHRDFGINILFGGVITSSSSSAAEIACSEMGYPRRGAIRLTPEQCAAGGNSTFVIHCVREVSSLKDCYWNHYSFLPCADDVELRCSLASSQISTRAQTTSIASTTRATSTAPITRATSTAPSPGFNHEMPEDDTDKKPKLSLLSELLLTGGLVSAAYFMGTLLNARKLKQANHNWSNCQAIGKALPLTCKNPLYFLLRREQPAGESNWEQLSYDVFKAVGPLEKYDGKPGGGCLST